MRPVTSIHTVSTSSASPIPPAMSGFEFKQRVESIDWRTMASLEVDKIIKNVDVACLQSIVDNLTFCDVGGKDFENVDPSFMKLFKCSQLIMEYLLYSQDYIIENRNQIKNECKNYLNEIQTLKDKVMQHEGRNQELAKELKLLKKTLYAYQLMAKMPGGIGENAHASVANYHRCDYCPKVFNSSFHLDNHLFRRHADKMPDKKQNALKDKNEILSVQNGAIDLQKITDSVEHFSTRVIESERQFRKELEDKMEAKLSEEIKRRQAMLEENYHQERLKYTQEIQDLKSKIQSELSQEKHAIEEQRRLIEKFMVRIDSIQNKSNQKPSSFGKIEDDDEFSKISHTLPKATAEKIEIKEISKIADTSESNQIKEMLDIEKRIQSEILALKNAPNNNVEVRNLEKKLNEALDEIKVLQTALIEERDKKEIPPINTTLPIQNHQMNSTETVKKEIQVTTRTSTITREPVAEVWNQILQRLKLFNEISNPDIPWAKNLFSHKSKLEFMNMRSIMEEDLRQELLKAGIDETYVIENWGKDAEVEQEILNICQQKMLSSEYQSAKDPIFGKMRSLLEKDLDNVLGIYYQPPIDLLLGITSIAPVDSKTHRRAASEPKVINPSVAINTKKVVTFGGRTRSNSVLSIEGIQQKLSGITSRLRKSSDATTRIPSPANPQPNSSKKKFGFKKAFKKLISKGKSKELPSPPTKDDISSISIAHESESPDDQSQATSVSESVDYSNPDRRIVFEKSSKVEESTVLESVTEISETNTPTQISSEDEAESSVSVDNSVNIKPIAEIAVIAEQKHNEEASQIEVVNFSDEEENVVPSIPAQWPHIKQESENDLPVNESKAEAGRSSEVSFNFSDLSDVTEISVEKGATLVRNYSDEEDNDKEIINAPVHILEKANVLQTAPAEDEKSLDISELLDHFSSQINSAPTAQKSKSQYDDELDIEDLEI